ncbi:ribonuclease J [Atopobacter phocae]|uniref:ribonuclease J n=1 Tax=Atopobacter phocae TaxID=136492 RepID=UPI00046FE351|nr:ribonuclease J [Atopobacter phocae]
MPDIKIIPLGGVREAGKSCFIVEVDDAIFVLDCGLMYPDNDLLGIDVVIPDFTYLEENKDRIEGIFLTHGHADAVGALPYLLEKIQVPVFGTDLTIELAKIYAEEASVDVKFNNYHVVDSETEIAFDNGVQISFIRMTHSIPDAVAIVLTTQAGSIVYTGDFKFDQSAKPMYQTDFGRLTDVGEQGVLALLADSREAESPVENSTEYLIRDEIVNIFLNAPGRVIVASIASNIHRLQQILEAAHETRRKVYLTGRKLERIIDTALKMDRLTLPDKDLIVDKKEIEKLPDNEVLILETGAMGEPTHALQQMAKGRHKDVTLKQGDYVYFATTPNIAMETVLAQTKDLIYQAEAEVAALPSHIKQSGHATPNDLKLLMNLLKPTYIIPVLGDFNKLLAQTNLSKEVGIPVRNTYVATNGDIISFVDGKMRISGEVTAGNVLVDGSGVGDIGNIVLKDRRILSEDGIFVAVLTISRRDKVILTGPRVMSRGFVFMKASGDMLKESQNLVKEVVETYLAGPDFDWGELKQKIRETLSRYLFEQTRRRPVVLPVIMEASNYRRQNRDKK